MSETRTKVLVALDGSTAAATAIPVAGVVAAQLGAKLEGFHVNTGGKPITDPRSRLHMEGVQAEINVVDSADPASAILAATRDPEVQLVVLTTHGRTVDPDRELGRVAKAVVAGASQPILLVRPEAVKTAGQPPPELRHLLVPFDGTPTTSSVLRPAAELACRLGASIDLLHVAHPGMQAEKEAGSITAPRYVDQPHHEWPAWSREVADRLAAACVGMKDVPVRVFLTHGRIGREITDFAVERHIDAIVVARRSGLEPGRAPVIRAVLAQTPCPVILVGPAD